MKLKELIAELQKIEAEHGGEMEIIVYDTENIHHQFASKVTYAADDGYMRPETVWIE